MIYFVSGEQYTLPTYRSVSIEDVVRYCSSKTVLAVDTETQGLDFTTDKMIMFQIGDKEHQFIIDTRYVDIFPLRDVLESKRIIKIFHNAKFDYKFIKQWSGITMENVYDTMLAEMVLNCGRKGISYSLASLCEKYLNIFMTKSVRNEFIGMKTQPFTDSQLEYGAKDVEYLISLRELQADKIKEFNLEPILDLENNATLAFADIEFNGLSINREKWLELANTAEDKSKELKEQLNTFILDNESLYKPYINRDIQGSLFDAVPEVEVNIKWTSSPQVLEVFNLYNMKLESVDAKYLHKFKKKYPILSPYVTFKEQTKLYTSYGSKFFDNFKGDGKIHTNFKQILNTGRVASSSPNMQQIPADNAYRNCFIPEPEHVFVSGDYSSQELCVIAFGSQDPIWLQALEKGEDLHSVCADLVYGDVWRDAAEDDCAYMEKKAKCNCPGHKKLRNGVKSINFGLAYGMSKFKLADTLLISEDEAEALMNKYFKAFPSIKGFLDALGNYGTRNGYIKTFAPYRRMRFFDEWDPMMDKKTAGDIERASKNTPIQGCSADMTKRAMVLVRDAIKDEGWNAKMVMTVHDQIDTICHKDEANKWCIRLTELMEQAALEIITNGLLKAEVEITDVWSK